MQDLSCPQGAGGVSWAVSVPEDTDLRSFLTGYLCHLFASRLPSRGFQACSSDK